jgi:hypothetical protein
MREVCSLRDIRSVFLACSAQSVVDCICLAVGAFRFAAQVDGGDSSLHRSGGALPEAVRRRDRGRVVVWCDAVCHAGGGVPF